jgi:hypothetical protein
LRQERRGKKFVVKVWSVAAAQYVEHDLNKSEIIDQRLPQHQRSWLQDIPTLEFSTPSFNPGLLNPRPLWD